jgi:hypothetical protein
VRVLTVNPRFLTVEECAEVYFFHQEIQLEGLEGKVRDDRDQPPVIQEWFDQWIGEAIAEYNLHPDDDRDELWAKFCEVVGR